jgi:hypothetical protein
LPNFTNNLGYSSLIAIAVPFFLKKSNPVVPGYLGPYSKKKRVFSLKRKRFFFQSVKKSDTPFRQPSKSKE